MNNIKSKKRWTQPVLLWLLCFALTGCGGQDGFFVEQKADEAEDAQSGETQEAEDAQSGETQEAEDAQSNETQEAEDTRPGETQEAKDTAPDETQEVKDTPPGEGQETADDSKDGQEPAVQRQRIYVQVSGAVLNPGVYELPEGSRIFEAIALAGGLTGEADGRRLNQALPVADGQMIYVYQEGEECISLPDGSVPEDAPDGAGSGAAWDLDQSGSKAGSPSSGNAGDDASGADGRINLNTAGAEQLMTLPGIGQAKAERIVSYRETHGAFERIEEIMEIEGIKEGVFSKIKDQIKVD